MEEGEYDDMDGMMDMDDFPMEGELNEDQIRQLQEIHAMQQMQMEGEYGEGDMDGYIDMEGEGYMDMEGEDMDDMEGMPSPGDEQTEQESPGRTHEDDGMHQEMSEMHDDGIADESVDGLNFASNPEFAHLPPLDQWRKSRRDILKSINDLREKDHKKELFVDLLGNKAANEYAEFLLDNRQNSDELKKIMEQNLFVAKDAECLIGEAFLDLDASNDDKEIPECYMDAHGLLFELQDELNVILSSKYSHIAIGLAYDKRQVKIVELYFRKSINIYQLSGTEDEGVEVQGQMLPNEEKKYDFGVYAVRIASLKNLKKDVVIVGPPGIKFDQNTQKFSVTFPGPIDAFYSDDEKILEMYMRKTSPPILYGQPSDERINISHLLIGDRIPMVLYPDPRIILEDEADKEREERLREAQLKQEEEDRLAEEIDREAKKREMDLKMTAIKDDNKEDTQSIVASSVVSGKSKAKHSQRAGSKGTKTPASQRSKDDGSLGKSKESGSEVEQEESELDDDESKSEDIKEKDDTIEEPPDLPSAEEMKRELITAIQEAKKERDQLKSKNGDLQKNIITMDTTFEQYDKQPDVSMNEHKYLNTLANVHQVRFNLKETQDRYNKMATELQAKLNEKQAKCDEIQKQFKDLKKSVAENSVFSRTGKKIKPEMISDWESREATKDSEVHHFRFQNIALRNRLANKEKILKKKEQLADGLHLIDFEQLKIENQTLNEKIEERNEELHKLNDKIHKAVITLSHTREKLKYVQSKNLEEEYKKVNEEWKTMKKALNNAKDAREGMRKMSQRLKQLTGIVNDNFLKEDYEKRKEEIAQLKQEIERLKEEHMRLGANIQKANRYQALQNMNR